ncbi:DUF6227 family protein [Streptomyces sp. NPDC091272]|uniref:DUF6227 family protein n=1 Tax=Streptomyces sp. NPDC091272 TaxID=3365981 RepID=UPI003821DAEC
MNDPYENESDGLESTEDHLGLLLGRALNSFDLPDETVDRLASALAHSSSLRSSHHSAGLRRSLHRHTFLLADGSSLTLWELVHNAGRDHRTEHELYTDVTEAGLAADRLSGNGGPAADGVPLFPEYIDGYDAIAVPDDLSEHVAGDLEVLSGLLARPRGEVRRSFVPDDSPDHARRVLRRAENADRPGEETARLLADALAHEITQVFGRQCRIQGREVGFTLYEHAFLLLDGGEASLWEVEHTATPDGRHMCEVYADKHSAREAMELRGRVR